jgi:hypothetical protein
LDWQTYVDQLYYEEAKVDQESAWNLRKLDLYKTTSIKGITIDGNGCSVRKITLFQSNYLNEMIETISLWTIVADVDKERFYVSSCCIFYGL